MSRSRRGSMREETAAVPHAGMQISPEQGQFMALLAELVEARRVLEVGTFTGYSALAVALALPPAGRTAPADGECLVVGSLRAGRGLRCGRTDC